MSDNEIELHRQSASLIEKHTYFLLGAVGACIAFAFTQSKDLSLNWCQLPLGMAVLSWALSFVFGCLRVQSLIGLKLVNIALLQIVAGTDQLSRNNPTAQKIGYDAAMESIKEVNKKVGFRFRLQFYFLILGVLFYFIWHVYQMYLNF